MPQHSKEHTPGSSIGVGLICLAAGAALLHYNHILWAWFFFLVSTYGLVIGILQLRLGYDKASNVSVVSVIIVAVAGIYINLINQTRLNWVLALAWISVAVLVTIASYGLFSSFRAGKARVFLKSLAIIIFALSLIVIFHFYTQRIFPLNAILIFMAAGSLRQGLNELFIGQNYEAVESVALFLLPYVFVLPLLIGGLVYYNELLFFHVLIIILVLGLFRFCTERFIPEIAMNERRKIGEEHPNQSRQSPLSLFGALTDFHTKINLLMLPLLLVYVGLSLDQHIVKSDIQSNVFQVSIGLLAIVAGFSTLVLGERLRKGDIGWVKQTYLLRGLAGITLLFVVIALFAFIGVTLKEVTQQASLLSPNDIVMRFLTNPDIQLQVIAISTYEFTFFAVPAALIYFYLLSRGFMERFERED